MWAENNERATFLAEWEMPTPAGENKRNEQGKAEIRETYTDTEQQKANAHKEKRGQRGMETNSMRENIDKGKGHGRQNDRERKTLGQQTEKQGGGQKDTLRERHNKYIFIGEKESQGEKEGEK